MKLAKWLVGVYVLAFSLTLSAQDIAPWQCSAIEGHTSLLFFTDGHTIHSCYRNHFLTKEISETCLEGVHIFKGNGLSWSVSHTGFSAYGTAEIRLGYGRRFGNKVSVVMQGCYLWRHARHYEGIHSFTIDISAAYQMSRKMTLAVFLYNPIRMKYGVVGDEIIPMDFNVLARYWAGKQVILDMFVHKRLPKGFELGGVVHFLPIKSLYLRLLCSNQRCGLAVMVGWKGLQFQIRGDWYYRLGIVPAIDIYGHFNNEQL